MQSDGPSDGAEHTGAGAGRERAGRGRLREEASVAGPLGPELSLRARVWPSKRITPPITAGIPSRRVAALILNFVGKLSLASITRSAPASSLSMLPGLRRSVRGSTSTEGSRRGREGLLWPRSPWADLGLVLRAESAVAGY